MVTEKYIYSGYKRLYIGATSNIVRTIVEANSLGGEKQSRNRPRDKIFIYPHKGLSSSLYEASAAKG